MEEVTREEIEKTLRENPRVEQILSFGLGNVAIHQRGKKGKGLAASALSALAAIREGRPGDKEEMEGLGRLVEFAQVVDEAKTLQELRENADRSNRMNRTCGTCKWSRFQMTKHDPPRPILGRAGNCEKTVEVPAVLPISVRLEEQRSYVWPTLKGCPVWEEKG